MAVSASRAISAAAGLIVSHAAKQRCSQYY